MSLIEHAKRELDLLKDEDPAFKDSILKAVEGFSSFGHSGGSASIAVEMLHQILLYNNITPLTDDPAEWRYHDAETWGEPGGVWQNIRNSAAFSKDQGKTYWLIGERERGGNTTYKSRSHLEREAS